MCVLFLKCFVLFLDYGVGKYFIDSLIGVYDVKWKF